jgi:hypothetical protein
MHYNKYIYTIMTIQYDKQIAGKIDITMNRLEITS